MGRPKRLLSYLGNLATVSVTFNSKPGKVINNSTHLRGWSCGLNEIPFANALSVAPGTSYCSRNSGHCRYYGACSVDICWGTVQPRTLCLPAGIPEIQEQSVGTVQFHQPVAEDAQGHRGQVRHQRPLLFQLSEVAFEIQHFLVHCDLQLHHNPSVNHGQEEPPPIHWTGIFNRGCKCTIPCPEFTPWRRRDRSACHPSRPLILPGSQLTGKERV